MKQVSEPARIATVATEEVVHTDGSQGVEGDGRRKPWAPGLAYAGARFAAPELPTVKEALVVCIESGIGSLQFGASRRQSLLEGGVRREKTTGGRAGRCAKAGEAVLAAGGGQGCAGECAVSALGLRGWGGGMCAR